MGSQFFIGRVYCFCMIKYRIILNIFNRTGVVMDEYRAGETSAVVLAVKCTALAVVLSVIGFYMPLISLVVFLLIPLPIAYLGMKEGGFMVDYCHGRHHDFGFCLFRVHFRRFPLRHLRRAWRDTGDLLQK